MEHTEFIKQQFLEHKKYVSNFINSGVMNSHTGCYYKHPNHLDLGNDKITEDDMYKMIENDLEIKCENIINHFHERF